MTPENYESLVMMNVCATKGSMQLQSDQWKLCEFCVQTGTGSYLPGLKLNLAKAHMALAIF